MGEPLLHLLRRKAVEYRLMDTGGAGKARVLMYHGIGEDDCHKVNVRHISQRFFARQLALFKDHFHVVPLDAVFAGERHPKKLTVAITFDDGHRNNLTHALPVLEEYSLPASFFITGANPIGLPVLWGDLLDLAERHTRSTLRVSGQHWSQNRKGRMALNGSGRLLRDHIKQAGGWAAKQELYDQLHPLLDGPLAGQRLFWELMTDHELGDFARHPLVSIGSHGWWHNDMGRIPTADAITELRNSLDYLHGLIGHPVRSLAWPDGSYSPDTVRAADELGLTMQLAVDYAREGDRHDPRLLDRYGVYDFPVSDRWLLHLIAKGAA